LPLRPSWAAELVEPAVRLGVHRDTKKLATDDTVDGSPPAATSCSRPRR
jgi:hypothetical protein